MWAPESVLVTVGRRTLIQVKGSSVLLLCNVRMRKLCMLFVKHTYENKHMC